MKKSKKLLSLLLTICMLLSAVPIVALPASAASVGNDFVINDLYYTILSVDGSVGTVSLYYQNVSSNLVEIPNTVIYDNITYSVISIGAQAFYSCSNLKSVTIGDGVTSIGAEAFRNCSNLESVTIGDGVTSIGEYAFDYCSSLTSVTIGDGVTSIGKYAFSNCSSLESVTIGDGVTNIGNYAFARCGALTNITIPNSIKSIGECAFFSCSKLTSITIPDSMVSIDNYAFSNTAYYNKSENWVSNVLYIGNHLIEAKTSIIGDYAIKDGTITISDSAFSDCKKLTSVTIPKSVRNICENAFNTLSLDKVTFETDNVNDITIQYNSFNITLPTESTKEATVEIYGFNNDTVVTKGNGTTTYGNVRNGQLLKPVLTGYEGNTELYYQFKTDNDDVNAALTFPTSDMFNQNFGYNSSYIFKNEAYAAIIAKYVPTKLICNVYEPVLTDGKLSFNLIAQCDYDYPMCSNANTDSTAGNEYDTNELKDEFSENNVLVMQVGDDATSFVEILAKAGFTHLHCKYVNFGSVERAQDYESVTINGTDKNAVIKPEKAGLSKINFTCYTNNCSYHGSAGTSTAPVEGSLYIYVVEKPTLSAGKTNITVKDNTTSPATSTYKIGLTNNGTVNGKKTTFTGLTGSTEYDVIQELSIPVQIDSQEYTYIGYYHNYITTIDFDPVCYIDTNSNDLFDGNDVKYETITEALAVAKPATETAENPTVIRMLNNSAENITIESERYITLDLNGYALKPSSTEAQTIVVKGKLTLTDGSDTKHYFTENADGLWVWDENETTTDEHSITGGMLTGSASKAAVKVEGGTFVMEKGNIVGNIITETGAGVFMWSGSFEMKGGLIAGNIAQYGGGVGVCGSGSFTMTGGEISNNIANGEGGCGGGVLVKDTGSFTMTGGTITGNKAKASGAGVCYENGTITLGGTAKITGNKVGTADSNLYIVTGKTVEISTDTAFANGAEIGITTVTVPTEGNPVRFTSNGVKTDLTYFTSDNAGYKVAYNAEKYLELKIPVGTPSVQADNDITVSGDTNTNIQNYIKSVKSELENDAEFVFSARKETVTTPNSKQQALINRAGTTANQAFYDVSFTKTEIIGGEAQTPVEITDAGTALFDFTIDYNMTGKCNLNIYRYHEEVGKDPVNVFERIYDKTDAADGKFYVDTANNKITIYISKFSSIEVTSDNIPEAVENATYAASLTLKDNIDVNFKIKNIPSAEEAKLKVYLNNSDTPTDFTLKNGETSAMSVSVSPENMSDYIHFKVVYDGIKVREFDYCIKDYCDAVAAAYTNDNATYGKLNDLCEAVLIYGKYAEDKKNDNTDSDLYDVSGLTLNAPAKNNSNFVNSTNIEKAGASLTLGSTISMNFYVKVKDGGIDLTETDENGQYKNFKILNNKAKKEKVVTNLTVTPLTDNADGYNYKITINNIYAEQMSREYTLTVNGDKTFTATYGIYDYCLEAQDGTAENGFTDTVKNLCKAIYNYGEKAAAFTA